MGKKHSAIILAAGSGSRMRMDIPKQFLDIQGKPAVYYPLKTFEDSFIDEIVLVTGDEWIDFCREEIIRRYGLRKVKAIVPGGAQRYDSVFNGLKELPEADYIYIHDGARIFITDDILNRGRMCAMEYRACAAGMPVKDTIKIVDEDDLVISTPPRDYVWQIQTPQIFSAGLIKAAYNQLITFADPKSMAITDDAMVVEKMTGVRVKLFEGSYENIKITTPDDLRIARSHKFTIKARSQ